MQIADGVAHGMGVFTNEHRFVQSAGILVHPGHAGVHLGVEVRESAAAVGAGGTCALVVYGAVVERFGHVVAIAEVLAVASLVAQAPYQHAGTIAVALYHALDAVGESRNPRCAVRDALIGVILKVCLVDTVQAVVIKHGVEACGIGIVGSTYGVDVILLHQHDVAQHLVGCHGATVERRGVVAVRTLEQDTLAVDVEQGTSYFYIAKSVFLGKSHFFVALGVALHDMNGVEVGLFRAPQFHVGEGECQSALGFCSLEEERRHLLLANQFSLGIVERYLDLLFRFVGSTMAVKEELYV